MAIYHLSAKVIGRAAGRSSVAAAAYRSGDRLRDDRAGVEHDYGRKGGIVHAEILAPANAPDWMRDRDRLWNAVEAAERRKDAQLAREIEVALPRELDRAARIELLRGFVERQFVGRGMIADVAVHEGRARDGGGQPHAHVMLTMRELTGEGFGKKERGWNAPEVLVGWREAWAREANMALERAGRVERVDHRTLEAQRAESARQAERAREVGRPELALVHDRQAVALDREPEPKLGPAAAALERRGLETERGTARREVEVRNQERRTLGEGQLALRLELAERGRAFVAAARERLDSLWSRAEAAIGRTRERARGEAEPPEQSRGADLRARIAAFLGRGRSEPERQHERRPPEVARDRAALDDQAFRERKDAILGRDLPSPDQSATRTCPERGGLDEQAFRERRDAILGREPREAERSAAGMDRERAAPAEDLDQARRDAILGRDRGEGRGARDDQRRNERRDQGQDRGRDRDRDRDRGWER